MSEEKIAVLRQSVVEHGYTKFEITYPGGKTYTRYLSPENINRDNDLRNEMCAWAEKKGFTVRVDLGNAVRGW